MKTCIVNDKIHSLRKVSLRLSKSTPFFSDESNSRERDKHVFLNIDLITQQVD